MRIINGLDELEALTGTTLGSTTIPGQVAPNDGVRTDTNGNQPEPREPLASNATDLRFVNPVTGLPLPGAAGGGQR